MFDLHNQRAASMPMMVGMMVCAVVVVCTGPDHNFNTIPARVFLYPSILPGVNEIGFKVLN
jgi:hypothetical protein